MTYIVSPHNEINTYTINTRTDLHEVVLNYLNSTDMVFSEEKNGINFIVYTPNGEYNGIAILLTSPQMAEIIPTSSQNLRLKQLSKECNYFCLVSNDILTICQCICRYIIGVL